ncbi:putative reverse transcriptase domain-containing protein [Tanacetum coccineum]
MAASPSPNHVFNFSSDEPHDFDDSDLAFEEDPQEEFEMNEPHLIFPYEEVGSPKPPPPESSDSEIEMTTEGDHVQRVACSEGGTRGNSCEEHKVEERMVQAGVVGVRPGEAIDVLAVYGSLSLPSRPFVFSTKLRVTVSWPYAAVGIFVSFVKHRNQFKTYHVVVLGSCYLMKYLWLPLTMPPRRLKQRAVERKMQKRVAEAIAEYERNRTNPEDAGGSGPANAGGVGVVGLTRWFEKMEQVFEISKCVEEDKAKFDACTFEGDDIEECNNWFHELALMCPNLVTPEKKKIELRKSRRMLPLQSLQVSMMLLTWLNRRQEAAKAYVDAPAGGKVYLRNLPLCNRCKLHHHDQCFVKCRKCKRIGHQTKDCWSKTSAADTPPTADANA